MISRVPPEKVRERLRKEVNLGCPFSGCGVPYLTWHHFDPHWKDKKHHDPEGMIALCATHAEQADGGKWTKGQLREMKQNPYVSLDKISDCYGYFRKKVVCIFGGFTAYNVRNILEIYGERVIGFERDNEGYDRLNVLIKDADGIPILIMENNFWTANVRNLFDLRCSAQGKELDIISKDKQTKLLMRFTDYSLSDFRKRLLEIREKSMSISDYEDWLEESKERMKKYMPDNEDWLEEWLEERKEDMKKYIQASRQDTSDIDRFISCMGSPESVPTWIVKGELHWGNVHLAIRDLEVEDLIRHNIIKGGIGVGGRTAFSFGDSTSIGVS